MLWVHNEVIAKGPKIDKKENLGFYGTKSLVRRIIRYRHRALPTQLLCLANNTTMNRKQITAKLRAILNRADVDSDGMLNRKKSLKHQDDIEVLLEHVSLLVLYLTFDTEASRRELFAIRSLLEN